MYYRNFSEISNRNNIMSRKRSKELHESHKLRCTECDNKMGGPQSPIQHSKVLSGSNPPEYVKSLSMTLFKDHSVQDHPFILFKFPGSCHVSYYYEVQHSTEDGPNRNRLHRLLKACDELDDRTGRANISWTKLEDLYTRLPVSLRKRQSALRIRNPHELVTGKERSEHADRRLGFRFDNMFAVKANFTFGQRRTNADEYHVIQTAGIPLLYNEPNKRYRSVVEEIWNASPLQGEARFESTDQIYFKTFVLNPYSFYLIPPNTVYVLVSTQKSLFSLDRITINWFHEMISNNDDWNNVHFELANSHKNLKAQVVESPMRTPPHKKINKSVDKEWIYNDELKLPQLIESRSFSSTTSCIGTSSSSDINHSIKIFGRRPFISNNITYSCYLLPSRRRHRNSEKATANASSTKPNNK